MSVAATSQSPFPYANGQLFPDSYFGETEPAAHHLPIFSEGGSFSFKDVLDTLNPLQHLPVISTIYREVTGDEPGAGARLAGATLYGGPIGLGVELVNCAIDDNTGKDMGGHMVAMAEDALGLSPSGGADTQLAADQATPTQVAAAAPAPGSPSTESAVAGAAAEPPPPVAAPLPPIAAEAVTAAPIPAGAPAGGGAPVNITAAELPAQTPVPGAVTAAAKPMPVPRAAAAHFLPVPQRQVVQPVQPPPVTVSLSNNGEMSHVPITGRPTYVSTGPSAATVQRVLASEGQTNAPLGAGPPGMTAPGVAPPPPGQDWFTASMTAALDKYQKSSKLADPPPATASP
jgi:hypothetical protein